MPTRILFVDDEPDLEMLIRQKYRKQIRRKEVELRFAANGRAALEAVDQAPTPFDLIITDINMPVMNGIELLGALGQRGVSTPVLVLSAYGDMNNIRQAMNCGAFDFLTKPIDFSDLAITQQKALGHLESMRERDRLAQEKRQLQARAGFIRETFGRYLSDSVVQTLLDDPQGLQLGGEKREVTIVLSDLRSFTPICERLDPEAVVSMLNRYFSAMIDIILEHGGTIDELIGDGILVIFGAPLDQADHADRAVRCSIAMQRAMEAVNRDNAAAGLPHLQMGIGVHTGEAIVGNIGSPRRAKYGIVGSNVNLTARIEGLTRGGQVLLSDNSHRACTLPLQVANSRAFNAKGFEEPVRVHELQAITGEAEASLPAPTTKAPAAPEPTPAAPPPAKTTVVAHSSDTDATQDHLATLGLMVAGIAHDIRNPLGFIINFAQISRELHDEVAEVLREHVPADVGADLHETLADVGDNLAKIKVHGERAAELVHSVMETVRGHRTPPTTIDLNRVLTRHLDLFEYSLRSAQPDLKVELCREFEPQLGMVTISGQDISRILLNLVHNACDAVQAKATPGTVTIKTRTQGDRIELRVHDTGIGVPPDLADSIFDPMVTSKGKASGLGLGLALVRDMVEAADGTIVFESTPGEFTEFVVSLPRTSG